jgi:ATP-dependent Clp protease adaptor protein ClpS
MTTMPDVDVVIDEKISVKIEKPKKYNVIILNDDVTPMEWVIQVLRNVFHFSQPTAENITLTIHNEGSAVVGSYSYEIAEEKAVEVTSLSRTNGFPLQVKVNEE